MKVSLVHRGVSSHGDSPGEGQKSYLIFCLPEQVLLLVCNRVYNMYKGQSSTRSIKTRCKIKKLHDTYMYKGRLSGWAGWVVALPKAYEL